MEKLILNNKKRIIAFMLAFTIVSSSFYVDYQKAYALDWAITEISLTAALKVLMGLLGVTVGVEVTDDWWEQQYNDCFNYTMNDVELTEQQISDWWNNVKKGVLDKTSPVWESFKEWIKSKFSSNDSIVSNEYISAINSICNINITDSPSISTGFTSAIACVDTSTNYAYFYFFNEERCELSFVDNYTLSVKRLVSGRYGSRIPDSGSYPLVGSGSYGFSSVSLDAYGSVGHVSSFGFTAAGYEYYFYNIDFPSVSTYHVWNPSLDDVISNNDYISAYENIQNIDAISDESTDVTSETAIPLPWQNDESIADSLEDVIDNAIDKVQTGEMTIEEYWEYVQEITNVYVYDTTTDETLPITTDSETGETEKIDDKITENKDNMAFTLSDMEKVFPFCIPFDIYAFVTLLVADPVAPVINFPITSVNGQTEVITIDFSEWESIVILFRYIFDFLLIIGLLLLARSLVGAGGDD